MKVLKIRRLGNSNIVVLPRELEDAGYAPGVSVVVEKLEDGSLRVVPAEQIREVIRNVGRRVVEENRGALEILAEHDRVAGAPPVAAG